MLQVFFAEAMRGDCRPAPVQTAPRRRRRRPTPWRRRRDPQRCELDRVRSGRMLGGAWPCARPARIQNCEHLYSFLESVKIINKLLLAVTCARPKSRGRRGRCSAEWNAGCGVVPWRPPAGRADRSMEGCHAGDLSSLLLQERSWQRHGAGCRRSPARSLTAGCVLHGGARVVYPGMPVAVVVYESCGERTQV